MSLPGTQKTTGRTRALDELQAWSEKLLRLKAQYAKLVANTTEIGRTIAEMEERQQYLSEIKTRMEQPHEPE